MYVINIFPRQAIPRVQRVALMDIERGAPAAVNWPKVIGPRAGRGATRGRGFLQG